MVTSKDRRSWRAHLLRRLPLQPLRCRKRRPLGQRSAAVGHRAALRLQGLWEARGRGSTGLQLEQIDRPADHRHSAADIEKTFNSLQVQLPSQPVEIS